MPHDSPAYAMMRGVFMRHFLSGFAPAWLFFLAVPAVLAALLLLIFRSADAADAVPDARAAAAVTFLTENGWQIDLSSCEQAEVRLPERFNAAYDRYNALQMAQGFDLTPYRGRDAVRVSFDVTNYDGGEGPGPVRANLLFVGDEIVAADVCSVALNGFMRGVRQ